MNLFSLWTRIGISSGRGLFIATLLTAIAGRAAAADIGDVFCHRAGESQLHPAGQDR
jgi:hypothetical protein